MVSSQLRSNLRPATGLSEIFFPVLVVRLDCPLPQPRELLRTFSIFLQ
jgi:hypothetical protein